MESITEEMQGDTWMSLYELSPVENTQEDIISQLPTIEDWETELEVGTVPLGEDLQIVFVDKLDVELNFCEIAPDTPPPSPPSPESSPRARARKQSFTALSRSREEPEGPRGKRQKLYELDENEPNIGEEERERRRKAKKDRDFRVRNQSKLHNAEADIISLRAQLEQRDEEIARLKEEIERKEEELQKKDEELERKDEEIDTLNNQMDCYYLYCF